MISISIETYYIDMIIVVLLAGTLGSILGIEREMTNKHAGVKTNMLICIGSALFTAIAHQVLLEYVGPTMDPLRVAAQVVSGIGFLGAGVILKENGSIKGLTTAALIWCVAAIGIIIGLKYYLLSILMTFLILVFILIDKLIVDVIRKRGNNEENY